MSSITQSLVSVLINIIYKMKKMKTNIINASICLTLSAFSLLSGCAFDGVNRVSVTSASRVFDNVASYNNKTASVDPVSDLRIYQVMVESFRDGDKTKDYLVGYGPSDHKGDLLGVTDSLEYIRSLNMNAIWLTPVFESAKEDETPSKLDATGYYTRNYYKVDRRFGDEKTLRQLVEKAHNLGLYVFLDGVFGHFRADLENQSPDGNHVTLTDKCLGSNGMPYNPPKNTLCADFNDDGSSLTYMKEVARRYIEEYKIDGFRLDQAYQLPPQALRAVRDTIESTSKTVTYKNKDGKTVNPLGYVVGEIWADNPSITRRGYGSSDNQILESNFDFGLRYALVQALAVEESGRSDRRALRILEGIKYDEMYMPTHAKPNLMISNHDLVRFGDLIQRAGLSDSYRQRVLLAFAYLATVHSGPVTNYYGEEIGQEVKGFDKRSSTMDYLDDHVARDNGRISGFTKQEQEIKSVFSALMKLRSEHPALSNGTLDILRVTGDLFAVKKTHKADDDFYILLNLSKSEYQEVSISSELIKNTSHYSLTDCTKTDKNENGDMIVRVAPLSFEIVKSNSIGQCQLIPLQAYILENRQ